MPEFIMPISNYREFESLPEFVQGYIEAAFFTECNSNNPELEHAEFDDIPKDHLANIIDDCNTWQAQNAELLNLAYQRDYDEKQAGSDYWFTRNGHGVGFWYREELDADNLGERLSNAARCSEVYVMRGDDGKVYFAC